MKFWVLNITGVALLMAGILQGAVATVFDGDSYRITWLIGVVFLVGLWKAFKGAWSDVDVIADWLMRLGLFGTVLGLAVSFYAVSGEANISLRDTGVGTALYTTLVGLVGSLWLEFNRWLLDEK